MKRYRYDQLTSDSIIKSHLITIKARWTIRGLSTVAVLFGLYEADMASGVNFFDGTPTVAKAATVNSSSATDNVNASTTNKEDNSAATKTPTATTASSTDSSVNTSTKATSAANDSAQQVTAADTAAKSSDANVAPTKEVTNNAAATTQPSNKATAPDPATVTTDPVTGAVTKTFVSPTTAPVIKAAVQSVEKTYDGTTNFNGGYPGVKFSVLGSENFGQPTLTTDDFDWSNVKADASTTPYSVTLNDNGIQAVLAANPNASFTKDDITAGTALVNKADVVLTADNKTKSVGQPDPELTASPDKLFPNGAKLNYTVSREPGETAGDYAINIKLGDNPNYNVTTKAGTFTIEPVTISAVVGNAKKTYDGTNDFHGGHPGVDFSISGADKFGQPTLTAADFDWSKVGTAVGTYSVTLNSDGIAAVLAANPNATFTTDDIKAGTAEIDKADVVLTADNQTKTLGQPDPALTATPDKVYPDGAKLNYTVSRAAGETVGVYPIKVTLGDNPNYNVTTKPGEFTITASSTNTDKAVITAVVGTVSKTYDGTSSFNDGHPGVSFKIVGSATLNQADLTAADFDWSNVKTDVGTYSVTLNDQGIAAVLAANPGATFLAKDVTAGTAEVKKADVTLTADSQSKSVGQPDPKLTATPDKVYPDGATLNYTVSRAAGETAGDYPIKITLGSNPNYNVTTKDGTFTIKANSTGTDASDQTAIISLVDENGQPVSNTSGAIGYSVSGKSGTPIDFSSVNKTVDGYKLITDETAAPVKYDSDSAKNQTFKLIYTKASDANNTTGTTTGTGEGTGTTTGTSTGEGTGTATGTGEGTGTTTGTGTSTGEGTGTANGSGTSISEGTGTATGTGSATNTGTPTDTGNATTTGTGTETANTSANAGTAVVPDTSAGSANESVTAANDTQPAVASNANAGSEANEANSNTEEKSNPANVVYETAKSQMKLTNTSSNGAATTRTARYHAGNQLPQTDEKVSHKGGFLGMLFAMILGWFGISLKPREKRN
ncbi:mucus-binding protein [Secundilactobacillus pentosiphilus]|uniref:Mucus-binding protein n=1 Tax=Secundilactobacillus pentosiphilus TaxID=1714682 RepID=A0A1Z5IL63_9LACO|nr:MBG domain-containing protein [Secundilactobacillus pentosiphilus]GAX02500.1 mucus-binding protein [Secundilactobacillus pentosiphilus]